MKLCDTCATCKRWEQPPVERMKHGTCRGIPDERKLDPQESPAWMGSSLGEGATLFTRADFGCLLWEAKA